MDINDWVPLLLSLGCDEANIQALCLLAQQGPAGRIEANRLVHTWASPGPGGRSGYDRAAQVIVVVVVVWLW